MGISPETTQSLLQSIAKLRVLVVGDVMLDEYIWGDVHRISPEAPVPVVHIHDRSWTAGGAANVALNAASLGAKAEVCGAVGRDEAGEKLREKLSEKNVVFDEALVEPNVPTIVKTRVVVRNQQLCRLDREDLRHKYANTSTNLREELAAKAAQVDAVIFSDYAKGFLTSSLVTRLRDTAHASNKFVAWDPKPTGRVHVQNLDLITPNRREAAELSQLAIGEDDRGVEPQICAEIWKRFAPKNLVVTLGAHGMLLSRKGLVEKEIKTAAREVYDVSGAGDTVIASLTLALVAGADLETAAHFANAAAGVVVGKLGTATVTPKELIAYVKR